MIATPIRWAVSLVGWMLDRHVQATNRAARRG